jgi:hypothetical protein
VFARPAITRLVMIETKLQIALVTVDLTRYTAHPGGRLIANE